MKTYNITIATCLLLFTFVANAQSNSNYKHPFSKETQVAVSVNFKVNSPAYSSTDNYKHPQYKVRSVVSKFQIPECCSKVKVSSLSYPNYKHPFNKFTGKTCSMEYVCSETIKLHCCL